jgi:galactokinase
MAYVGVGPGRIDMMGGVADYSGSWVLQVATARATTVTATLAPASSSAGPAGVVELASDPFGAFSVTLAPLRAAVSAGEHASLDLKAVRAFLTELKAPSWVFYVYGSLAVFVRETGWLPAADTTLSLGVTSTVPASQGVSSSASIEVGTLRALMAVSGVSVTPLRTAHIAQAAENYVVGAPCGLMDQLASALGSPGKVLPILCRPDQVRDAVPLPETVTVVGWPSGVKHDVAGSPYLTARTATFMAKRIVEGLLKRKVAHITEFSPSVLLTVLEQVPESITGAAFLEQYGGVDDNLSVIAPGDVYAVRNSARFPVEESFRGSVALPLLQSLGSLPAGSQGYTDTLTAIGELMMQTHRAYTSIGLGCPETDVMIARLMELGPAKGIYGARMSGGGSGGTVAVLCEKAAIPLVEALGKEVVFDEPFPGLIQ